MKTFKTRPYCDRGATLRIPEAVEGLRDKSWPHGMNSTNSLVAQKYRSLSPSRMTAPPRSAFGLYRAVAPTLALLIAGGLIYLAFRPAKLEMFNWAEDLAIGGAVRGLRATLADVQPWVPIWMIYSLPQALWTYALVSLMGLVWRGSAKLSRIAWMATAIAVALSPEVGQGLHVIPGTFDPIDLATCFLAIILSLTSERGITAYDAASAFRRNTGCVHDSRIWERRIVIADRERR